MTPTIEPALSARGRAIATGLIRSKRADSRGVFDNGMLRLDRKGGGYYWISLNGARLLKGDKIFDADELQPGFADAMMLSG